MDVGRDSAGRRLTSIGDATQWILRACVFAADPLTGSMSVPHPSTIQRRLARFNGGVLDELSGIFFTTLARPPEHAVSKHPSQRTAFGVGSGSADTVREARKNNDTFSTNPEVKPYVFYAPST